MHKKTVTKFSTCLITLLILSTVPFITNAQVRIIAPDNNPRMAFLANETSDGFTIEGSFIIENPQDSTLTVDLLPVDGARTSDGTFATKPPQETQTKLGDWIKLSTSGTSIESNSETTINFTFLAPLNTDPGIYHGGIISTAKARTKRGETNPPRNHSTILPVFIKIPGEEIISTAFNSFAYSTEKNQIYYNYQIANNGNTIIVARPTLESKLFGIFTKQTSLAEKKLFPGDSINFFTNLHNKPLPGIYIANGIVGFSNYDIFTDTSTPITTEQKSLKINHRMHNYLLIPVIFLLLCSFYLFKKICLKRAYLKGIPYRPKQGETLQSIAKNFHIKWIKLAKINHMKPPFSVNTFSTIIIPKRKFKKYGTDNKTNTPPTTTPENPSSPTNSSPPTSPATRVTAATATTLLTLLMLFSYADNVNSQNTQATLEVKSGAIFITPPDSITLDKWFIPTEETGPSQVYKTLSPEIAPNQLRIHDYDTGGIGYKVSISSSNLSHMDIPHSILPFTNISLVTLAVDTENNIDILGGTRDLTDITIPSACPWNATSGTLEQNCDTLLTQKTFMGDGQIIQTDPTSSITENETLLPVTDSSLYNQGDIIKFLDTTNPQGSAISYEKALVTEIISPTEILTVRGISGTTPLPHQPAIDIKNFGSYSLEQDIFVAPETVNRATIYSMGFGIRTILEPNLQLHPGPYTGTITFTLYTL